MKSFKKPKEKEEHMSIQGSISKSPGGAKKFSKTPGLQHPKTAAPGKDVFSTMCGFSRQLGDCNLDKGYDPGTVSQLSSDVKQVERKLLYSSSKMKLQLFPVDERFRIGLEKDGHIPFLELTLSARKKISSVLKHLSSKWGSSSIAMGELMLFPFNTTPDDFSSSKRWTASEINISAGDVHAAIGSPEIFRLRYGWFDFQHNISSPSLPNCGHVKSVCCGTINDTSKTKDGDGTSKELETCNECEISDIAVEQTAPSEALNQVPHKNQGEGKNEDSKPSRSSKIGNDTVLEENSSDAPYKYEESSFDTSISQASLLWPDLSNISIGGLLSEASLQGKFNTEDPRLSGSRLVSHSIASDSLDAFIEQFKYPQASTTLSSDMPSSILDAESTCQSFAFSRPMSSTKDLPTYRQNAFSGLSDQNAGSESFKRPKSEVTQGAGILDSSTGQEAKTDSLLFSLGVYNNENSLGLSSLKWNDSLGPFDIPFTARQIVKDDTTSIGGFVR